MDIEDDVESIKITKTKEKPRINTNEEQREKTQKRHDEIKDGINYLKDNKMFTKTELSIDGQMSY